MFLQVVALAGHLLEGQNAILIFEKTACTEHSTVILGQLTPFLAVASEVWMTSVVLPTSPGELATKRSPNRDMTERSLHS